MGTMKPTAGSKRLGNTASRRPRERKRDQSVEARALYNRDHASAPVYDLTERADLRKKRGILPSNRNTAQRLDQSRTQGAGLSSPSGVSQRRKAGTRRKQSYR